MKRRADVPIREPLHSAHAGARDLLHVRHDRARAEPRGPFGIGFGRACEHRLEMWYGPIAVFRPEPDFWADRTIGRPRFTNIKARYYMFATFNAPGRRRGTQILVADSPLGPFTPHSDGPVTPEEFEALDGTLYVAGRRRPVDGVLPSGCRYKTVRCGRSRSPPTCRRPPDHPEKLFAASDAPWSR